VLPAPLVLLVPLPLEAWSFAAAGRLSEVPELKPGPAPPSAPPPGGAMESAGGVDLGIESRGAGEWRPLLPRRLEPRRAGLGFAGGRVAGDVDRGGTETVGAVAWGEACCTEIRAGEPLVVGRTAAPDAAAVLAAVADTA
jgi:hypothetical protein